MPQHKVDFKPFGVAPELVNFHQPKPEFKRPSLVAQVHQAKNVISTIVSEMKPDETRKIKFVYQNSGVQAWPSDVKLIRVSGDHLETEINASQNEV